MKRVSPVQVLINIAISASLLFAIRAESDTDMMKRVQAAQHIVCGSYIKLLKNAYEGVYLKSGRKIQGFWVEIFFKVDNTIKGNVRQNENIIIRYFLSSDPSGDYFNEIPEKGRCLLFLEEDAARKRDFILEDSDEPILKLPDQVINLNDIENPQQRMEQVLLHVLKMDKSDMFVPALSSLLGMIDQVKKEAYLRTLSEKVDPNVAGYIYARQLTSGDTNAARKIDLLLQSGPISTDMCISIAQALEDIGNDNGYRLKPFLVKWSSSDYAEISRVAYWELLRFTDVNDLPILISALDHKDNLVKCRAIVSLTNIAGPRKKRSGQNITFPIKNVSEAVELWKIWWNKEGREKYSKQRGTSGTMGSDN